MKRARRVFLFFLFGMFVILLETCNLAPSVSITDRITSFVNSLNTDRSTTSANLDPAVVAPTQTQWDGFFGTSYEPYSFSPSPITSNPSDVETNITGAGAAVWGPFLYKFIMVNVGTGGSDDWRIHSLQINNPTWTTVF